MLQEKNYYCAREGRREGGEEVQLEYGWAERKEGPEGKSIGNAVRLPVEGRKMGGKKEREKLEDMFGSSRKGEASE